MDILLRIDNFLQEQEKRPDPVKERKKNERERKQREAKAVRRRIETAQDRIEGMRDAAARRDLPGFYGK